MKQETITLNFARSIPVFPLPGSVLLPHGMLPLHVFEPRYRQMARDALDSFGLIAIGLFDGEVSQSDYYDGNPPLRPHVCVGYCEQYKSLPDGRYLLMLRGLCRARIHREVPHEPYRRFMLKPIEAQARRDEALTERRQALTILLNDARLRSLHGIEELRPLLDQSIPTAALFDIVSMQINDDAEWRYALLAEQDALPRADRLLAKLRQMRRSSASVG